MPPVKTGRDEDLLATRNREMALERGTPLGRRRQLSRRRRST